MARIQNRKHLHHAGAGDQGFVVIGIGHPYNASILELHDGRVADGRDQVDLGNFDSKPFMTAEQRLDLANSKSAFKPTNDKFLLNQLETLNQSPSSPFTDTSISPT